MSPKLLLSSVAAVIALVGAGFIAGNVAGSNSDSSGSADDPAPAIGDPPPATDALAGGFQAKSGAAVSRSRVGRKRAARIAVRHVRKRFGRPARVTDIDREDDFGARWEVEVTRRNGAEFDVYVNARGRVVRVVRDR